MRIPGFDRWGESSSCGWRCGRASARSFLTFCRYFSFPTLIHRPSRGTAATHEEWATLGSGPYPECGGMGRSKSFNLPETLLSGDTTFSSDRKPAMTFDKYWGMCSQSYAPSSLAWNRHGSS